MLNAISVRPDPDFHRDMDRLIEGLKRGLQAGATHISFPRNPRRKRLIRRRLLLGGIGIIPVALLVLMLAWGGISDQSTRGTAANPRPTGTATPPPTVTPSLTPSPTATNTPSPTVTPSLTPSPTATNTPPPTVTPDYGVATLVAMLALTPISSPTATPTATSTATATSSPTPTATPTNTPTDTPTITPTPVCYASSRTGFAVPIYCGPGVGCDILDYLEPGDSRPALIWTDANNGFVYVAPGWANTDDVILSPSAACSALLRISTKDRSAAERCKVRVSGLRGDLRQRPDVNEPRQRVLSSGDVVSVLRVGRGTDGQIWYYGATAGDEWSFGWIPAVQVQPIGSLPCPSPEGE